MPLGQAVVRGACGPQPSGSARQSQVVANEKQPLTSPRAPFVSRSCCDMGHDLMLQLLRLARYACTTRLRAAQQTTTELLPPPGASQHALTNGCSDLPGCHVTDHACNGARAGRASNKSHRPSSVALHKRSKMLVPRSPRGAVSLRRPGPSGNRPNTSHHSACGAWHHGMSTTAHPANGATRRELEWYG